MTSTQVKADINALANPTKATLAQRFFRTGKGQYGEGDLFLGLTVPAQRRIAKQYRSLSHTHIDRLMRSKYHEHRLVALLILVDQFQRGEESTKRHITNAYLSYTKWINNWDLVDTSAYHILGAWIVDHNKDKTMLTTLAHSHDLWEKRIAIVATLALIRNGNTKETIRISKILLSDTHDLIHKAVGWMLREAGKKQPAILTHFLDAHAHKMPRTMLRYAIEKLPPQTRQYYMQKKKGA